MRSHLYIPIAAISVSSLFVGCLEEDNTAEMEGLLEKLEGQRFDIGRTMQIVAAEEMKLANYEKAAKDTKEIASLSMALGENETSIEDVQIRNAELAEAVKTAELAFQQYQGHYRVQARKTAIGKTVDLSATKGAKFKAVRVMAVSPLAIKIYMSSGPQVIPLRDITPEVRELLQMSEEEATEFLKKKDENAVARVEKHKIWKEGQADRDVEASRDEIIERMNSAREEIQKREDGINIRLQQMKGWKSKASNLELDASREKNEGKSKRLERQAELARDKALILSDENSDSWIVVGRLRAELEDLKRRGIR